MLQYFKSALMIAALAGTSIFQPANAAVSAAPLPFMKTISVSPQGFSVELSQKENTETIQFIIRNFTGRRLNLVLRAPDGTILESARIRNTIGETLRNYVFTSAEEGTYSLEVADGKDKIVKKISIERVFSVGRTQLTIQ